MTEEEYEDYQKFANLVHYKNLMVETFEEYKKVYLFEDKKAFNPQSFLWMLKNHFDIFSLIESGIALEKD